MKKIFIILLMILCGCETTSLIENGIKKSNNSLNPKCEDVTSFKVFQVLDTFVLATVCKDSDDHLCLGHTVYFQKEEDKIYYDEQKINVKSDECAIYIGTFKYEANNKSIKTVPKVKIINSKIQN